MNKIVNKTKQAFQKLTIKLAIIYLIMSALTFSFFSFLISNNQMEMITENARFETTSLVNTVIAQVKQQHTSESQVTLSKLKVFIDRALLLDSNGVIIQSYGSMNYENAWIKSGILKANLLQKTQNLEFFFTTYPARSEIHYFVNLHLDGTEKQYLFLPMYLSQINNQFNSLLVLIIVSLSLSALLQLILGGFIHQIIVKPLQTLNKASQQVAHGKFLPINTTERNDEIGELTSSYNYMVEIINKTFNALDENRKSLKVKFNRANFEATTDPLTGANNRRALFNFLEVELERAIESAHSISVIMIDIDFFKKVNDQYGHQAGDAVLKGFAQTMMDNLKVDDFFARYGGEEFAIVLSNVTQSDVLSVAERLREKAEQLEVIYDLLKLKFTISMGISHIKTVKEANMAVISKIIGKADEALYKAKTEGRNRCVMHRENSLD